MEIISQDYQETLDELAYKLTVGRRLAELTVEKPYPGPKTNMGYIVRQEVEAPPGPPPALKLFEDEDED